MTQGWRLLVFGASGAIGGAVASHAKARGWHVTGATRGEPTALPGNITWVQYDPLDERNGDANLAGQAPFDAICWAQGANMNDSIASFDISRHLALYRANCLSVIAGMAAMVRRALLSPNGARLVLVSSIWQERARGGKLSYAVTKAAIGGLVRSAAVDLGGDGHLVNGVLPGVLDTPMTRANLSPEQVATVSERTAAGRLPDLDTLAETVLFLCSTQNSSISGQSITVDLGMSNSCLL